VIEVTKYVPRGEIARVGFKSSPRRLKPQLECNAYGTAEAVPFPFLLEHGSSEAATSEAATSKAATSEAATLEAARRGKPRLYTTFFGKL
jgi:hypothetical protein